MILRFFPYSLPILSGILIGTSYIPFPPWAIFFCQVPLWLFWLRESDWKKVFIGGWITQFILNLIGFHWIAHTVVEFGRMPWAVGIIVLFLFCSLAHLYYPLAGLAWKWLSTRWGLSPRAALLLLPLVFAAIERVYPFIFFWHMGYTWLWAGFPGSQASEWIGFYGLNMITLAINGLFLLAWQWRKNRRPFWIPALAAIFLFLITNLLGVFP